MRTYAEYAWARAEELLAIDSPTGFTDRAAAWVREAFSSLGYDARITNKGGVIVDLGGPQTDDGLMLCAHADTLGGMVAGIKADGRLRLTGLGGMEPNNGECENVRVYTRDGHVYEGTLYLHNPSVHVNGDYATARRSWDTTEVVLDEDVRSESDARALGIEVGDIVCFDPRTRRTASGYGAYYSTADMPIPMVADCADYETYRSGKFIPGIMGTLFSLVDKLVSSLAATVVSIAVGFIGYNGLPTKTTPYMDGMNWVVVALFCLVPMVAWALTLIAMRGYELDGKRIKTIHAVNAARKEAIANGMSMEDAMRTITDETVSA